MTTSLTAADPAAEAAGFPDWGQAGANAVAAVPDEAVDAYWRALNYLSAAQLYLADNARMARPLRHEDLKASPRGHWGVCPPVNYLLAHLGPLTAHRPPGSELLVLHGAGHAGPSALAHAYLNQNLPPTGSGTWSIAALRTLVGGFPDPGRFGSEVTPLIPGVRHTGGQLGPALSVAQGMALDAPHRLVVPLIGDGELETGATAAAWLARRALLGTGEHGTVLPVVLANGLRMGGPSLLAGLTGEEITAYFTGLGYQPLIADGSDLPAFRRLLADALASLQPLAGAGPQPVVVLTMPKGKTGPEQVGGRQIAGTPAVHKTPLANPLENDDEFAALATWLASYRPTELLTAQGRPSELVRQALPGPAAEPPAAGPAVIRQRQSWSDVSAVVRARAEHPGFRLFSPDEIASNRLSLSPDGSTPDWAVEILNEEICHAWLQGYTETGRDALLATYEAFAPVNTSLLVQHLKHRNLRHAAGHANLPSVNYLITSLGWRNTYTHQNPGLASAMLELEDPSVHIYAPADATRAAAVLAAMLTSRDRVNFLITDKHSGVSFPPGPFRDELTRGAAIWPHLSFGRGTPDLVLASAGDIPARQLAETARELRRIRAATTIRYLHINDLTVLGPAGTWPAALTRQAFTDLFGADCPVLLAVPTFPGAVRALLAARGEADRFHVVGYRDPGRPTSNGALLEHAGLSVPVLSARATRLIEEHRR
ncbi:phosphoketolase family protein [Streptacidiphilus fuscans]|uniref:Phosphoketolase n=1 Tax=Streptacidiphilus fuscans TaxID=2789292 RepID=A0A931FIG0_9ACTN|nr:phosphoketolase [Streptacidiphilus fuscans]MBF9071749.1 phosphoketolase [Streptacidiphilus fuscans]